MSFGITCTCCACPPTALPYRCKLPSDSILVFDPLIIIPLVFVSASPVTNPATLPRTTLVALQNMSVSQDFVEFLRTVDADVSRPDDYLMEVAEVFKVVLHRSF